MGRWLRSGLRRDLCAVVCAAESPTDRDLKREIETHYGASIRPRTFYGALEDLVEGDYLAVEADGVHDRYRLTDAGERALYEHYAWLRDCLGDPPAD